MRICIIVLVVILIGCKSPKKKYDFTFFKWNIHESYYLKFNSSDTLYYINAYGYNKKETFFAILNKEEKERIQNILDTITFPRVEEFESMVDDGETNVFVLKNESQFRKLKIHGHNGPNRFWLFGKSLDQLKSSHQFVKTNKKIDLTEIDKTLFVPPPPIIDTLK